MNRRQRHIETPPTKLGHYLNFTGYDLAINRAGSLSPVQRRKIRQQALGILAASLTFIVIVILTLRGINLSPSVQTPLIGASALLMVYLIVRGFVPRVYDLFSDRALMIEDVLQFRTNATSKFRVGNTLLTRVSQSTPLEIGKLYRVYYTPHSHLLLSMEIISRP